MKLIAELQHLFRAPGPTRKAAIALLVAWALAAIWGWFFVEPTVLRDNQSARDFVAFATKVFPWLDNISKLGEPSEKAKFLQCVFYFLFAPFAIADALLWALVGRKRKNENSEGVEKLLIRGAALTACLGLILSIHLSLTEPSGEIHRMDILVYINEISVPLVSPLPGYIFWATLTFIAAVLWKLVRIGRFV